MKDNIELSNVLMIINTLSVTCGVSHQTFISKCSQVMDSVEKKDGVIEEYKKASYKNNTFSARRGTRYLLKFMGIPEEVYLKCKHEEGDIGILELYWRILGVKLNKFYA